ncbi:Ger(x)C family spore germination protein [Anoxybacillus suryakundensis]|uniref:Germination protein, Ger(X)C family n=1 Tax=Anoxybacillus suryakundensis TaxID=1325335 RepID=A0A0K6GMM1_9BACL|nr:Ger(x)C family spore germination protein [Anoxybacillus suryakundensis]CUA79751.1 germination protein, Ger(x)C family [Anoxybacillus suryakundensis]
MRRHIYFVLCFLLTVGCSMQTRLDELTLVLTVGLDEGKNGNLLVYSVSPVFNKEAKNIYEVIRTSGLTLRDNRFKANAFASGKMVGGKTQNIIISKNLAKKYDMFSYLDVLYRDPKNSTTANFIVFDGPLKKLMYIRLGDKPRLSVAIRDVILTAHTSKQTTKVNMLDFRRSASDRAQTPFAPILKVQKGDLVAGGIALFNKQRKYVGFLSQKESPYFAILQKNIKPATSLTLAIKGLTKQKEYVSISIEKGDFSYKPSFQNGMFRFDVHIHLGAILTETTTHIDMKKEKKKLEQLLAKEIQKQLEAIVKKMQTYEVDPIGFGLYARAYEYKHFKKQKSWPKAFAKAEINIRPTVEIISYGVLQ